MEVRIYAARISSAVVVRSPRAFGFAVLIAFSTAAHAAFVTPEEAGGHIGEDVTVCGVVASATYAANAPMAPSFLDLGKPYLIKSSRRSFLETTDQNSEYPRPRCEKRTSVLRDGYFSTRETQK
jgi:hypothetical protein